LHVLQVLNEESVQSAPLEEFLELRVGWSEALHLVLDQIGLRLAEGDHPKGEFRMVCGVEQHPLGNLARLRFVGPSSAAQVDPIDDEQLHSQV
jgi:hypothetical protein